MLAATVAFVEDRNRSLGIWFRRRCPAGQVSQQDGPRISSGQHHARLRMESFHGVPAPPRARARVEPRGAGKTVPRLKPGILSSGISRLLILIVGQSMRKGIVRSGPPAMKNPKKPGLMNGTGIRLNQNAHTLASHPDVVSLWLLLLRGFSFAVYCLRRRFLFQDDKFHYPLEGHDRFLGAGELPAMIGLFWGSHAAHRLHGLYPTNLLHLVFLLGYAFKLHLILHVMRPASGRIFCSGGCDRPLPSFAGSLIYHFSRDVVSS